MKHCLLIMTAICLPLFAHKGYQTNASQKAEKLDRINKQLIVTDKLPFNPPAEGSDYTPATAINGVDTLTFAKMKADGVPINASADDSTFIRRVSLILTGRLPDPDTTRAFLADTSANKRAAYIDSMLESEAFDAHWSFWHQEFFKSTSVFLRLGTYNYNTWFEEAVAANKPLDQMARELITASGITDQSGPANFYVRSSEGARLAQDRWDNFAVAASDKFLGVQLLCISCHDGAYHLEDINLYLTDQKRQDLWAMAAFFADVQIRRGTVNEQNQILSFDISHRNTGGYIAETDSGDRPIRSGGLIEPKYLFTGEQPAPGENKLDAIARMITSDRQFARNWANRLWGHAFGLAMVEPMDSFDPYRIDASKTLPEGWDQQALDLDLLEHMTDQMIAFNYDTKAFLRYMLNSATFALDSVWHAGEWQESWTPYYSRYLARRMSSESIYDCIQTATGVVIPVAQLSRNSDPVYVDYAHQLMDPSQPRDRTQRPIRDFLDAFGRGNRYDQFRSEEGNIGQALQLMNSNVISARLLHPDNRFFQYVDQGLDLDGIIDNLFLDALSRNATTEEKDLLKTELVNYPETRDKATTIQWLLLNRLEFVFIY